MTRREPSPYVGRFAPSPTGPLHFGSLVAAVASYLEARTNNGRWLLRIEDIDPPREQPGASTGIVDTLERYGFEWDDATIFQSASHDLHLAALQSLFDRDLAYRCRCSRRDLEHAPRGPLGIIYPGTCRTGCGTGEASIRVRTDNSEIKFDDRYQGPYEHRLESESGDFVVRRRDGLIAYQLAVVVDDHKQGITDVVRGIDLIDSTPRQIYLQKLLGYTTPGYAHIPVITHTNGDKYSKLTGAPAISKSEVKATLIDALAALGLNPPDTLNRESVPEIWAWARENWLTGQLFGQKSIIKTS